jgi:sugar lactone lactonase YvrE
LVEILGPGNLQWSKKGVTIFGNGYGADLDQLQFPEGLFIEPKTQILYVTDVSSNNVKKRYPNGDIQIAAGQVKGAGGSTPDKLNGPREIFADENETVFVADTGNQRIQSWRKNAKTGQTVAGDGRAGTALNEFQRPYRVVLDSKRNIVVADLDNQRITRWPSTYDPRTSQGTIIAVSN